MPYKILIRKLRRPARIAPDATLIAHLQTSFADGSTETNGAWFGTDKAELTSRVNAYAQAQQPTPV